MFAASTNVPIYADRGSKDGLKGKVTERGRETRGRNQRNRCDREQDIYRILRIEYVQYVRTYTVRTIQNVLYKGIIKEMLVTV